MGEFGLRDLHFQRLVEEGRERGLRPGHGDAGLEPAEYLHPALAAVFERPLVRGKVRRHHDRNVDLGGEHGLHPHKAARRHADDGQGMAVDEHRLAENSNIRAEAGLPVIVAEDGVRRPAGGAVVGGDEEAADGGFQAEHGEVGAGNQLAGDALVAAREAGGEDRIIARQHAGEDLVAVAEIEINRVGERVHAAVIAVIPAHFLELDQGR